VNQESGEEEKTSLCAHNNKPDSVKNCNPEECKTDLGKLSYLISCPVYIKWPLNVFGHLKE